MNPEDLLKKNKEQLIDDLSERNTIYDEIVGEIVMIKEELLYRLKIDKKDGEIIGEYSIKEVKKVTFKTTLEQAEELGAVKKVPDSGILKKLYNKGVKVPGIKITKYLSVRRLAQEEV